MKSKLSIITAFVLLNMIIGRLFQESLGIICFTELSIFAATGFAFWTIFAKKISVWATTYTIDSGRKNILIQGGLGLSTSLINILIGQVLVIFLMALLFNCTSPSANLLNASLTNNIAVNLLCYFSLLTYFVHVKRQKKEAFTDDEKVVKDTQAGISVTRSGSKFLLSSEQVVHIEASNNCVILHTELGKFVRYQSLKSILELLPKERFKRIHRSSVVNTDFIKCCSKNRNGDGFLNLRTGEKLRFSRTYQKEIPQL